MKKSLVLFCFIFLIASTGKSQTVSAQYQELLKKVTLNIQHKTPAGRLIEFAKTMIGVPYRYASNNPALGFDCSGFVNYVFSNFGFKVPRSSRDFASSGETKKLEDAKIGDVILFTGTNSRVRTPGHVGIIYAIDGDQVKFIHSSSGHSKGVTISSLDEGFYKKRFIKVVSIL